jgi:tetratricopeptide (TPR) repeat protein
LGELGASDEAYLAFVSLKKLFPENTEVRWQFLLWAKANDRLAESLAEAEGIWSDPDITERAKVAYASQLLTLNPRDQPSAALAVRWAEGLLRQDSANPAYWALRGDVARWLDDLPTAEESWRHCLSLPGGAQWPVFQQILQLDLDKGDSEALLFDAKAAQVAHPEHPFGPLFLGVAQSRKGEHALAHAILTEGINRFGSDKEVREQYLLYLGEVCYRLGLLNEFRGHFDEAISISRSNPTVLNNYAYFLALLKIDLKKAEALALRAVAIADQEASFWDTLATVYASQGKHAKAQLAMDRAHSLGADPTKSLQRTNEASEL